MTASRIDAMARSREAVSSVLANSSQPIDALATARQRDRALFERMVALQEDLDWALYAQLGLIEDTAALDAAAAKLDSNAEWYRLAPGHRPFELVMAKSGAATTWFERNGYTTTALPEDHPLKELIAARVAVIERNAQVAFIERPEFKRRWGVRDWDAEVRAACEAVILDAVEAELKREPAARSLRELSAPLLKSERMRAVMDVCFAGDDRPLDRVAELVARESVPYLAAMRFTAAGWEKRGAWERCWALQRREDAGESVGAIEVPPKYDAKDYRDARWWSLRGRLDVARERFISYPGATTDDDASPLYGWAGWNHRERADALAALYQSRKLDAGWSGEPLVALLAGLNELVPWLLQWHNAPEDGAEQGSGEAYAAFVSEEGREQGVTREQLSQWGAGDAGAVKKGKRGRGKKGAG
jgi:hypothetical protein